MDHGHHRPAGANLSGLPRLVVLLTWTIWRDRPRESWVANSPTTEDTRTIHAQQVTSLPMQWRGWRRWKKMHPGLSICCGQTKMRSSSRSTLGSSIHMTPIVSIFNALMPHDAIPHRYGGVSLDIDIAPGELEPPRPI